jgi:hypothetical protein
MSEPQNGLAEFMIGLMCGIGCAIATAVLAYLAMMSTPPEQTMQGPILAVALAATIALVVHLFRNGLNVRAAGVIIGAALPFIAMGACAAAVTRAIG